MDKKTREQKRKEWKKEHGFNFKYLKIYLIAWFVITISVLYLVGNLSEHMLTVVVLFLGVLLALTYPTLRYLTNKEILK